MQHTSSHFISFDSGKTYFLSCFRIMRSRIRLFMSRSFYFDVLRLPINSFSSLRRMQSKECMKALWKVLQLIKFRIEAELNQHDLLTSCQICTNLVQLDSHVGRPPSSRIVRSLNYSPIPLSIDCRLDALFELKLTRKCCFSSELWKQNFVTFRMYATELQTIFFQTQKLFENFFPQQLSRFISATLLRQN